MEGLIIKSCAIFNSALKSPKKKPSDDEAQDAKLLYYYPQNEGSVLKHTMKIDFTDASVVTSLAIFSLPWRIVV